MNNCRPIDIAPDDERHLVNPAPWGLFEHCGDWDEKLISAWSNYDDAWCAYQEQYTAEEREELGVEIALWDADEQTWTMVY